MTTQPDPGALLKEARMRLWVLADLPHVDAQAAVEVLWSGWAAAATSSLRTERGITRTYLLRHPTDMWALFPVPDWTALAAAPATDQAAAPERGRDALQIALGATLQRAVVASSWTALLGEVLDGAGVMSWTEVLLDGHAVLPDRADLVRLVLDGATEDDAAAGAVLAALHGFRVRRRR